MATPKIVNDGVTPFNEDNMNLFIAGNGVKVQIKVNYAVILESGAAPIVSPSNDSCGIVTGDLTYDGGPDVLEIAIAGYTNPPVVIATPLVGANTYNVKAHAISNAEINVWFFDINTGAQIATGSYESDMKFNLLVIGY